jgi:phosphoenolpyruvate-protein kinase (PTS system EI component)
MVAQVSDLVGRIEQGRLLQVDGTRGLVRLDPEVEQSQRTAAQVRSLPGRTSTTTMTRTEIPGLPCVEANINLLCEVAPALEQGMSGVGLYRSEFLFLARRTLPTEEEQVGVYSKLLHMLEGRPASIRTFDLRPDKLSHYHYLSVSSPHALDWRLVLASPPLQKLFKDQVRAILRAAAIGPARILVPLITRTEQVDFVLETVGQAHAELCREGLEHSPDVPLGIMIEVAAATAMVETWATHVDFFALGTNDLIASALGIDRDDPVGATTNDPLHPGLLRMVYDVITAGHRASRRVTVCGEMASDAEGAVALSALGVDSLSVAVNQLASVRQVLAHLSLKNLPDFASQLRNLRNAEQARELLRLG